MKRIVIIPILLFVAALLWRVGIQQRNIAFQRESNEE